MQVMCVGGQCAQAPDLAEPHLRTLPNSGYERERATPSFETDTSSDQSLRRAVTVNGLGACLSVRARLLEYEGLLMKHLPELSNQCTGR